MLLNTVKALLVTLLVTFLVPWADAAMPFSQCPEHLAFVLSAKIDPTLKGLIHKEELEKAERSFVVVAVDFTKPIHQNEIKKFLRYPKNLTLGKQTYDLHPIFIFRNDSHIVDSLTDLAALDTVHKITLSSSIDNTNNKLDVRPAGLSSSEDVYESEYFKNTPTVTVRFPSDYLSRAEIRQAANKAISSAIKAIDTRAIKNHLPRREVDPRKILVTTELTISTYRDDGSLFTPGATITFKVNFTFPGISVASLRVAVIRNSITGDFDHARVE